MNLTRATLSGEGQAAVRDLFNNASPVRVELRFPHMGTASDWCLLHDNDELDPILDPLGPGTKVILGSVLDTKIGKGIEIDR
jgi:hypothetical protein